MPSVFVCGVSYDRLLVCGGRDFKNENLVWKKLVELSPRVVIHGGARGTDMLADVAARGLGIQVEIYKANWDKHGKSAGPIRNVEMLKNGKPDAVLAFPGGKGTAHMMMIAEKAGVPVIRVNESC